MKWFGACMVLLCTSWFGHHYSMLYTKRERQLKQLIFSFHIMDAEIVHNQRPLQETFSIISEKLADPLQQYYQSLVDEMETIITNLSVIWEKETDNLLQISALQKDEIIVLKQFGHTLGDYALIKQHEQITLTIIYLEQILEQAMEERKKYSKLYTKLGIFLGIFLVILLM